MTTATTAPPRSRASGGASPFGTASARRVASCALAIGGLDPGGGAGIAADLRAFAAAGAFGCAAVAVLTVQSTAGLRSVRPVLARELAAAAAEVMRHQRVRSVKVGALGGRANVLAVAKLLAQHAAVPVIVDTPIAATRNAATRGKTRGPGDAFRSTAKVSASARPRLLDAGALAALKEELFPLAMLVTVNVDEAEALLGERVRSVSEAHDAARALAALGPRAVLVKGGHLTGANAIDVLAVDGEVIELRARRLAIEPTHGTGCTFASLIAGRLAVRGPARVDRDALVAAIRWAKRAHHHALSQAVDVGRGLRVIVF